MTSVLVVGAGLIGTSVGLALRAAGWTVYLADADPRSAALGADMGAGAPHDGEPVDLLLAAVPPGRTGGVLADAVRRGLAGTYTDVASVKLRPQRDLEDAGADASRYVGGHPMAGRERAGAAGARHDLFAGQPWILTPSPHSAPDAVAAVEELARACGASPVRMGAAEHDEALAAVSHAPQLLASALAAGLLDLHDPAVAIAGQGLRDMVRIAASDPELWADIAASNARPLAHALDGVVRRLEAVRAALDADGEGAAGAVGALLRDGNRGQARLPGKHGGPERHFETVAVVVGDRPGELARLLADAGEAGVNVEDLRVEHTPGRPTGVVELYVDPAARTPLRQTLRTKGWSAH